MTRTARIILAGSVALLTAMPALASRISDQPVQGWSAMGDSNAAQLLARIDSLPESDRAASDQPYCAPDSEIHRTLRHDFEEQPVESADGDMTRLWGSAQLGTWTVVVGRDDRTSCIIASGIGFDPAQDAEVYFQTAGLGD
ncbi:hypothetical protein [Paracoccus seriniphilus]|uniref:hypothetical protein n=1 Tax=Paracoccus seriniphilus TaxID=184748 RepID=UPI0035612DBA